MNVFKRLVSLAAVVALSSMGIVVVQAKGVDAELVKCADVSANAVVLEVYNTDRAITDYSVAIDTVTNGYELMNADVAAEGIPRYVVSQGKLVVTGSGLLSEIGANKKLATVTVLFNRVLDSSVSLNCKLSYSSEGNLEEHTLLISVPAYTGDDEDVNSTDDAVTGGVIVNAAGGAGKDAIGVSSDPMVWGTTDSGVVFSDRPTVYNTGVKEVKEVGVSLKSQVEESLRIYEDSINVAHTVNGWVYSLYDERGTLIGAEEGRGYFSEILFEGLAEDSFYTLFVDTNGIAGIIELNLKTESLDALENTYHTVSFNTTGGTSIDSVKVKRGSKVSEPEAPIKYGCRFAGWYIGQGYVEVYDFNEPIKRDIILYAAWNEIPDEELNADKFIMAVGSKEALVWGVPKIVDATPKVVNDRVVVPVRFIAENLGGKVDWEPIERRVTIITPDKDIILIVGHDRVYVNGRALVLDVPAFIDEGRVYVSIEFINNILGVETEWNEDSRQVIIKHNDV